MSLAVALLVLAVSTPAQDAPRVERGMLLERHGPGAYAIPKMIATSSGVVLVVAQDRQGGDWGAPIDPILMRSEHRGRAWSGPVRLPTDTASPRRFHVKPTAIVEDREQGRVHVFLVRSPLRTEDGEPIDEAWYYTHIQEGQRLGRAWHVITSEDDGLTWSEPREITSQLIVEPHWQEWSPVHVGLQLRDGDHAGRLVVPVRCYCPPEDPSEAYDVAHQTNAVIYSDDDGLTWTPGGRCLPRHGETSMAELPGGTLYLNHRRSRGGGSLRDWSRSHDGGETFTEHGVHEDLPDQRCHAGLAATERGLFFSNVPGSTRVGLTLSHSADRGATWTRHAVLEPGPAAYSTLAALPGGALLCVYETGEDTSRQHLAWSLIEIP